MTQRNAESAPEPDALGIYPIEIAAMLRRRWRWLIAPTLIGALVAGGAAMVRQPVYRSSATLQIDSPQIPTTLIASPITEVASERIAKIRQQIVSPESLTRLIANNGLYAEQKAKMDRTQLLDMMRGAVGVNLVGANQGQGQGSTISFNVSFDYTDAATAQNVTTELARMFVLADDRSRKEQATGTADFLTQTSDELSRQLRELSEKKRSVEARYAGALPSDVAISSQSSSAIRSEITRTDAETQGLVQQAALLAARQQELQQAPPQGMEGLNSAEERLTRLLATHSEQFPDVIAARREVERQRSLLRRQPVVSETPIDAEIAASRQRIATLASRRAELVRSMEDIDRRVAMAPQSAYELNTIEREYDNIKHQYDTLREKQLNAQVAASLQSEGKGERFKIVEQPDLPLGPMGAPKWQILLLGIIAGFSTGLFGVIARELLGGIIHGSRSLRRALPAAPLLGTISVAGASTAVGNGIFAALRRLSPSFMGARA